MAVLRGRDAQRVREGPGTAGRDAAGARDPPWAQNQLGAQDGPGSTLAPVSVPTGAARSASGSRAKGRWSSSCSPRAFLSLSGPRLLRAFR